MRTTALFLCVAICTIVACVRGGAPTADAGSAIAEPRGQTNLQPTAAVSATDTMDLPPGGLPAPSTSASTAPPNAADPNIECP
jgi:hypothetical protein